MPYPSDLGAVARRQSYNRFLLLVAGLGGLLYGVDVGIISGALPYLEATSGFNQGQLSFIVAAVLLGSVISTVFAGMLADLFGRRALMALSGVLFVTSIPTIALAHGYEALVLGRLLQGVSAGFIGVVVPLYLAECLGAAQRGRGTGVFQWLLTLGIVAAAVIGFWFSLRLDALARTSAAAEVFAFKDAAWRRIFWVSLPPGLLFVAGTLFVTESPRWLYRRGRVEAARQALLRSRTAAEADLELAEMAARATATPAAAGAHAPADSLWRKKYIVPFVLACVVLACNQTTGINSILGYSTTILLQSGLSDLHAHLGNLGLTLVNFLLTIVGVVLVDRKGRKFLLSLGSAGIIASLFTVGLLFHRTESRQLDCGPAVQGQVSADQTLRLKFDRAEAAKLVGQRDAALLRAERLSIIVIYSFGDFRAATKVVRTDDAAGAVMRIERGACVPPNKVVAFFTNPLAQLEPARTAPLRIEHALIAPVPTEANGWLTACGLFAFMSFFALGPGVCVWLALSELMPTRIRSNGMSIALLINQVVSTFIAAVFLPTVGQHGYASMFWIFAGCTVVYFVTATFFLPETKGKTLEEIEAAFSR